jgi:c-di-AMP phosphodiesterase-like protein
MKILRFKYSIWIGAILILCGAIFFVFYLNAKMIDDADTWNNPIDSYFLHRINDSVSESERRELQDTYKGVWEDEFYTIVEWAEAEYSDQEYKSIIANYVENVEIQLDTAMNILYIGHSTSKIPLADNIDQLINAGNANRSFANELCGQIYRNAAMILIKMHQTEENIYLFLEKDYSLEHYE